MKLVGKLKDDVANAKSPEEAKQLIENAGMQLTDEELEHISGGDGVDDILGMRKRKYDKDGNPIGWKGGFR